MKVKYINICREATFYLFTIFLLSYPSLSCSQLPFICIFLTFYAKVLVFWCFAFYGFPFITDERFLPFTFYDFAVQVSGAHCFWILFHKYNNIYKYPSIVRFRKALNERFLALMEWKSHKEIAFDFIWENSHRNTKSHVKFALISRRKLMKSIYFLFFCFGYFCCSVIEMSQSDFLSIY